MLNQPDPNYESSDMVMTPAPLARLIVDTALRGVPHTGTALDPARGDGLFYNAMLQHFGAGHVDWCEITAGRDFFDYQDRVSWIITNRPWSLLNARKKRTRFLEQAFRCADNVVFLLTVNHGMGLKARRRLAKQYGFGICCIIYVDTPPKPWPQGGFQLGTIHWQKGYAGDIHEIEARSAMEVGYA